MENNHRGRNNVVIFAKAPIPGKVKTRLGKTMGMRNSAAIYKQMLYRMLGRLAERKEY